jgi:hypothetical protein
LNPRSAYTVAADSTICAVAALPTPPLKIGAIVIVFKMLPVKMNVFDADSGNCWKPRTACCAATKALVVLTFRSRVKSERGREKICFGSFRDPADALG